MSHTHLGAVAPKSRIIRNACAGLPWSLDQLEQRIVLSSTVPVTTQLNTSGLQGVVQTVAKLDDLANEIKSIDKKLTDVIGKLPLVGNGVKDAVNGANDKFLGVADTIEGAIKTLQSAAHITGVDIQGAIWTALGPGGANILPATITDASKVPITLTDTDGDTTNAEQVNLDLNITGNLFTANLNPSFDLGLPGLGLKIDGTVQAQLNYSIFLDIGANTTDGIFLDLGQHADDVSLTLDITTPGLSATGTLAFLQLKATDGTPKGNTKLTGTIAADLNVTGGKLTPSTLTSITSHSSLSANAEMDLHLHNVLSFGASSEFPSVLADLDLTWNLGSVSLDSGGVSSTAGSEPDLQFNNVKLDLGSFFSQFVTPIVQKVQEITAPLQPLFDLLNTRMPVFSDISFFNSWDTDGDGKVSLLEVMDHVEPQNTKFIDVVNKINRLVQSIPAIGANVELDLGHFEIGGASNVNNADIRNLTDLTGVDLTTIVPTDLTAALGSLGPAGQEAADFLNTLASGAFGGAGGDDGGGIKFPIIDNPKSAFGLLLGQNVDLFTFDTPKLDLNEPLDEFFSILGPLGVELKGNLDPQNDFASVTAHLSGGFDTAGLTEWAGDGFKPADIGDLFDGFYVLDDPTKTYAHAGIGLSAYAALNVVVASAGVGGGFTGHIDFSVNDPGETSPPLFDDGQGADGRLRPKEIGFDLGMSPLCLFNISGKITASLDAFIKVGVDTPFGFAGWEKDFDIASTTLADFSSGCSSMPATQPELATKIGDGVLRLNMGPNAGARGSGDVDDDDESFVVSHVSTEPDGTETVNVTALGYVQKYSGVKKIYAEGGLGNDSIVLNPGVVSPAELYGDFNGAPGGDGNDTLTSADGPATLHGGGGDDVITAGAGAVMAYGEAGKDILTGSENADLLDGGADDDNVYGKGGADSLIGGDGNDNLDGGDGADSIEGDAGQDSLYGGDGNDSLFGGADNDVLEGDAGNDNLDGGAGNDLIFGDEVFAPSDPINKNTDALFGKNLNNSGVANSLHINLQPGGGDDSITGGDGNDVMFGQGGKDSISGGAGSDYAQGNSGDDQMDGGDDNDFLIGGQGNDNLSGGKGNDVLIGDDGDVTALGVALLSPSATDGNDAMAGNDGNDSMYGEGGADSMTGNAGDDLLNGGDGNDIILGDNGTIAGNTATLANSLTDGADSIGGGSGADQLFGQGGNDSMTGDAGNDSMVGGQGADNMDGGADDDMMLGDDGSITGNTAMLAPSATDGNDNMSGGSGNDQMYGEGGSDVMNGNAGNDAMFGGVGADSMVGGQGNDRMDGEDGADIMLGDDGSITGNTVTLANSLTDGNDTMNGNADDDVMYGQGGDDDMIGGTGGDLMDGGAGQDVMLGDDGTIAPASPAAIQPDTNSVLRIATPASLTVGGNDSMSGGDGNDFMYGQGGTDAMHGNGGDDYMEGNAGADNMTGDAGDDDMIGGSSVANTADGADSMDGGDGNDVMLGDNGQIARLVDGTNHYVRNTVANKRGLQDNSAVRNVTLFPDSDSVGGNDSMTGGANDDVMYGEVGNDSMLGNDGNDQMIGGLGADFMDGGAGNDGMIGDKGTITPSIFDGSTQQTIQTNNKKLQQVINVKGTINWVVTLLDSTNGGNDSMNGGLGDDAMHGGAGADVMNGDDPTNAALGGTDWIFGDDGDDKVNAGAGNDNVFGGVGNDSLDGGAGADIIYGGDGDDTLIADIGDDQLIDWFGNFNNFIVPGKGYGSPTITRSPSPNVQDFLLGLGSADGASDSNGELAVVTPPSPSNSGPGGRTK